MRCLAQYAGTHNSKLLLRIVMLLRSDADHLHCCSCNRQPLQLGPAATTHHCTTWHQAVHCPGARIKCLADTDCNALRCHNFDSTSTTTSPATHLPTPLRARSSLICSAQMRSKRAHSAALASRGWSKHVACRSCVALQVRRVGRVMPATRVQGGDRQHARRIAGQAE
jgi:hypothetical protein